MNKQLLLLPIFLIVISAVLAQPKTDKVFWKEDFASGKLPKGWITVAANDSSTTWFVTDQPFPGSYGRNYQAPPIASEVADTIYKLPPALKLGKMLKSGKKPVFFLKHTFKPNRSIARDTILWF